MFLLISCNSVDIVPFFNKNYSIIDEELTDIEYEEEKDVKYGDDFLQNYDIYLQKRGNKIKHFCIG